MTDTGLIVQLKAGKNGAAEQLLDRYYKQVVVSIRRQLETRITDDETGVLARSVFARAELTAADLRHDESLGVWLAGLTNTVVSEYISSCDLPPSSEIGIHFTAGELPPW